MSQYLILIYGDEAEYVNVDEARNAEIMNGHAAFGQKFGANIVGGNALQPVATATTVRGDDSVGFTITDGPFAETKEVLGGYYLVEAADLDAAIELAKQVPTISGGIEVRPVMVFN